MYDKLRRECYWLDLVSDVYGTVQSCNECPQMRAKLKHQRPRQLFPAASSLKFVAIDIFRSLPRTQSGNHHYIAMTEKYFKPARAISTTRVTSSHVAKIFLYYWFFAQVIPNFVLFESGRQFISTFLMSPCASWELINSIQLVIAGNQTCWWNDINALLWVNYACISPNMSVTGILVYNRGQFHTTANCTYPLEKPLQSHVYATPTTADDT